MTDNRPNGIFMESDTSGVSICYRLPNDRMHYAYSENGAPEMIPLETSNILIGREGNSLWESDQSYLIIPEELL